MTAAQYLLVRSQFSAFHQLQSDEVWSHLEGGPALIHTISPDEGHRTLILGNPLLHPGASYMQAVPRGIMFAVELSPECEEVYGLFGLCVAPGFSFDSFFMPSREALIA